MGSTSAGRSRKPPFEEYDPADDVKPGLAHKMSKLLTPTPTTSYQLLVQSCGGSESDLRKWATIRRLTSTCQVHKNISEYIANSSGGIKIGVKTIYKVDRTDERDPFEDTFRILLWHGTKPAFVPSIIQTGFRKGTGGLFGGGIYFADRIAKSAGYVGKTSNGTAFYILAEVAPGRIYKSHHHHSNYQSPPQGFDSVKGMGSQIPTWKQNKSYYGAILPGGVTTQNQRHSQYDMAYNEYIVYDPNKIIVRFIVECNM